MQGAPKQTKTNFQESRHLQFKYLCIVKDVGRQRRELVVVHVPEVAEA